MEEEWVFLGESGSDAETVGSVDDEGSETGFAMVQLGRSHAKADAGKNQDEEEEDEDYFDLNLPALAGSKAVFGANGDCFDLDPAASILSMGSVGYDSGIHGADNEDDIDTVSLGAPDGHGDGTVHPEHVLCAHCASANIDTDQSSGVAKRVKYDDIDTSSSDSWESDYDEDDERSEAAGTNETRKPYIDPLWLAALDDFMKDSAQQRRLAAMPPPPWRQVRPPGAPHLFFPQPSRSTYSSDAEESHRDSAISELAKYDDEDNKHSDAAGTQEPHKPYIDPLWQAALDDFIEDSAQQRRLAAMAPPPWRQVRPPGAPHLFFPQPSRSTYSDAEESRRDSAISELVKYEDENDKCSDAARTDEPHKPYTDPLWQAALDDFMEDSAQQRRLAAMPPPPWRQVQPLGAPHLFFSQPSRSTSSSDAEESGRDSAISEFVNVVMARENALTLFDEMESLLELSVLRFEQIRLEGRP